jgi:serine/threonine protein kinase
LEGEQLGRYRLLRLLGSGGMGEVYLAEDARISQQVAIKIIRTEGIAYPESESAKDAARLFEREARAIARLDHPNILPLYAYGEETLHGIPLTYLVMPYRKEGTLANWLRQRGSTAFLTPEEATPLVQQAAVALQHAHDQQVIHQDIKPTNFLIRLRDDQPSRPDLLLADFGIARLTSATASASQSIRGTPTYMAPEQWEGHPVPATDQYALAIMAYELLVGRPPFQGGPGQVMRQHYLTPPPAPSALNPQLSPAIDAVIMRALAKQPEERFSSVAAFAQAFQEATQHRGDLHATPDAPAVLESKMPASFPRDHILAPTLQAASTPLPPTVAASAAHKSPSLPEVTRVSSPLPFQPGAKHRRTTIILAAAAAVVVVAGLLTWLFISNATSPQGNAVFQPDYPPIDGVYCDQLEQTAYHHHVLLTIYIDDQQVTVPADVGLAGNASSPTCYYWLHTHDTTGIVHIEAPSSGSDTLKNFLDIWQSFANSNSTITYPSQLASSAGWAIYIDGKQVNKDFNHIDISSNAAWHELITIMYNSPSARPVTTYAWPAGY